MLMSEAMKIINGQTGYMVFFWHKKNDFLYSDHFPDKDKGDSLIPTAEEAWELARRFALRTVGKCVNVYVVGCDFSAVPYRGGHGWMFNRT